MTPEETKEYMREYRQLPHAKAAHNLRAKAFQATNRLAALEHYSGSPPHCQCPGGCTETHLDFLAIDHINGGGGRHRKETGGGDAFVSWLKRNGYPPGFRVLCHNCNTAIGHHGHCPHEKEAHAADGSV